MRSTDRLARRLVALVAIVGGSACGARSKVSPAPVELVVTVGAPGASAELVETSITNPLEDVLSRVPHLAHLRSLSRAGRAEIAVELEPGSDLELSRQATTEAISSVRRQLPTSADPPLVTRRPGAIAARYLITSTAQPLTELGVFTRKALVRSLETVAGVASIELCGVIAPIVEVSLDMSAMASSGLDVDAVVDALARAPAESVEQLGDAVVRESGAGRVRVRDVARVSLSGRPDGCTAYHRGQRAIEMIVHAQHGADVVAVTASVAAALAKLTLPASVHIVAAVPSTAVAFRVASDASHLDARIPSGTFEILEVRTNEPWLGFVANTDDPDRAVAALARMPGVVAAGTPDATIEITGPDLNALDAVARGLAVKPIAIIGGEDSPEQRLDIDRNRAADLGVSTVAIATTMAAVIAGVEVPRRFGAPPAASSGVPETTLVRIAAPDPSALGEVMVRASSGALVPLSQLVTATMSTSRDIAHVDRQRMLGLRVRAADVTSLPEMKPGMSIRLVRD